MIILNSQEGKINPIGMLYFLILISILHFSFRRPKTMSNQAMNNYNNNKQEEIAAVILLPLHTLLKVGSFSIHSQVQLARITRNF